MPNDGSRAADRRHGLPPIAHCDARLLLLGSLPGEASLSAERYYAHPRNHFWRLVGEVLGEPLELLGYEARLDRLVSRGVALWDVVHSAERQGSLDQALRSVATRNLAAFVQGLPALRAIGFNGATAARLGRRALAATPLPLVDLPSSSPAYTLGFEAKADKWKALRAFLD